MKSKKTYLIGMEGEKSLLIRIWFTEEPTEDFEVSHYEICPNGLLRLFSPADQRLAIYEIAPHAWRMIALLEPDKVLQKQKASE